MIKDFTTYINEGLFDRNQSEFVIRKTDKGIEQIYIPKTRDELEKYIELDIEQAKKEGTYPNVDLNNIDVSKLGNDVLNGLFSGDIINPDISSWDIKYIPSNFFDSNEQIKEFTIPNGVTSIGDYAFESCTSLASVTISNGVTSIGDYAFESCTSLKYIEIPNSVTSIGEGVFQDCSGLKSVKIPNGVTSIGDSTFYGCESLTSVTIPNSVTSIGDDAFGGCSKLTSVTIPNSVTSIGDGAFRWCSLTSVMIPNSVTSIGSWAFRDCSGLTFAVISKHCRISVNDYFSSFPENCKITRRND